MSGALSSNPKTGKVRVDYNTETMTIVVTKDTVNDERTSYPMSQRSGTNTITSFLTQLANEKKK